jgi:predicted amidohydrolase YtcJ
MIAMSVMCPGQPLAGDINGDGVLSFEDVQSLNALLAEAGGDTGSQTPLADVNEDGTVDVKDVLYLRIALKPEFRPERFRCLYNGYLLTVNPYAALAEDSMEDRYRLVVLHAVLVHPDTGRIIATYPALEGGPDTGVTFARLIDDYPQLNTAENPDPPGLNAVQLINYWRARGIGDELLLGSEYLNLQGAVVTPGLIDDHFHVNSWSKKLPREGERFGFYADVGDPHYYTDTETWDRVCVRQALWQIVTDANNYIAEENKAGVFLHGYWYTLIDDPPPSAGEETFLFRRTADCQDSSYNPDYLLNRVGMPPQYPFQGPADPCGSDPITWPPLDYESRPAVLVHTSGQACWYNSALLEAFNVQQVEEWGDLFSVTPLLTANPAGNEGMWHLEVDGNSPSAPEIMNLTPPFGVDVLVLHDGEADPWYVPFWVTQKLDATTLEAQPGLPQITNDAFAGTVDSLMAVPFYRPIPECIPMDDWIAAAQYWGEPAASAGVAYGYWDPVKPYDTNWYNGPERGLVQYFLDEAAGVWRPSGYAEHYVMRDMLSSIVIGEVTVEQGMEYRRILARWCHRHGLTAVNDIMFYRRDSNPADFWANAGLTFNRRFPGGQWFYPEHDLAPGTATGDLNLRVGLYYYLENVAEVEQVITLAAAPSQESDVDRLRPPGIHPEYPGWVRWLGWKLQLDGGTGARTFFSSAPLVKNRLEDEYPTEDEDGHAITFLNHSFGLLTMTNVQEQEFSSRETAAIYWLVRESDPALPGFYNADMAGDWTFLRDGVTEWLDLAGNAGQMRPDLVADLGRLNRVTWTDDAQKNILADKIVSLLNQVDSGWNRTLMAMAAVWYQKSVAAAAGKPIPGQTVCHCIGDGAVDLYIRAIKQLKSDVESFPADYQDLPEYWQAVIPPDADLSIVQREFDNTRFRVEHLLNFACGALDDLKGNGGIDSLTTPAGRNVVFSTQPALLAVDGQAIREGFPMPQELWEIPNNLVSDFWEGVPAIPRWHHHMPAPLYIHHDIPFTLNTDPPSVRDPRPAMTIIAAVARTPVEIDPSHWLDQTGAEPDYRPPDYLAGKLYAPLGLTPQTPENPMQLTVEQSLCAMTYWAAYVAGWETEIGALAVPTGDAATEGWYADMVVWSVNPLAITGPTGWTLEELGRIPEGYEDATRLATANSFIEKFRPWMTIVGGVPVYIRQQTGRGQSAGSE